MTSKEPVRPVMYRSKIPWLSWILLLICMLGFIAAVPLGYLNYVLEIANHGTARALDSLIPYIGIGSIFGLCALIVVIRLILNKPVEIIFEPDFLQISHKGRKIQIAYNEIQQIFRRDEINIFLIFPFRKKDVRIQTPHGIAKLEANIKNYDQMINELEKRVYPAVYLHSQEVLLNGKALKFGTMLLNQRGIKLNENIILWNQIASVAVNRGKVVVRYWLESKIKEQKLSAGTMPNLPVFIKLAEENIHSAGNV